MKYVKPERLTEQSLILDVRTPDEIREEALSLPFFNEELSKLNPRDFVSGRQQNAEYHLPFRITFAAGGRAV